MKMYKNGVTFGTWDLLHPGHLNFLKHASTQCDNLTIGLHIDPSIERSEKIPPAEGVLERYFRLLHFIDGVNTKVSIIPYETEEDVRIILEAFDFNVRFLGGEYQDVPQTDLTGNDICVRKNIVIMYIGRDHPWSTTSIKNRIYDLMSTIRAL